MSFWETGAWFDYERAYGDEVGARSVILANAEFRTRIVDLRQSEVALWRGVRRSYHSIINGLDREYGGATKSREVHLGKPAPEAMRAAQGIHLMCAGGTTRRTETWLVMRDWIRDGRAALAIAELDGYAFFAVHDGWAYYFSAATRERDLGLGLIWWGALALQARGVRWLELGWQVAAATEKEEHIEFVRRGFGGRDVPASWSGRSLTEEEWGG